MIDHHCHPFALEPGQLDLSQLDQKDDLADLSGCDTHLIFRIDTVVDRLLEEGANFDDLTRRFDAALQQAADDGYVGLKTILAYRTGLRIDPTVTERQARDSVEDRAPVRRRAKPLR